MKWIRAFAVLASSSAVVTACTDEVADAMADDPVNAALYDSAAYDAAMMDPAYYDSFDDGAAFYSLTPKAMATGAVVQAPLPAPLYGLLRTWGALAAQCGTSTSDSTDADNDGVPVRYEVTFDCASQQAFGRTVDLRGKVTLTDQDDTNASAPLTVNFEGLYVKVASPDGFVRARTVQGTSSRSVDAQSGKRVIAHDLTVDYRIERTDTIPVAGSYTNRGTSTYQPADAGDPFQSGTLSVAGRLDVQHDGQTSSYTRTSDPVLHWNRACREAVPPGVGFDDGTLHFTGNGEVVNVAFQGCSTRVVTR